MTKEKTPRPSHRQRMEAHPYLGIVGDVGELTVGVVGTGDPNTFGGNWKGLGEVRQECTELKQVEGVDEINVTEHSVVRSWLRSGTWFPTRLSRGRLPQRLRGEVKTRQCPRSGKKRFRGSSANKADLTTVERQA